MYYVQILIPIEAKDRVDALIRAEALEERFTRANAVASVMKVTEENVLDPQAYVIFDWETGTLRSKIDKIDSKKG